MNTDTTKRYRSIKELFNWTTGHIVPIGELFEQIPNTQKYYNKKGWFVSEDACLNKDYFEEVLPVSEPAKGRVTVSIGACAENNKTSYNTVFQTNIPITSELSPKVQSAIEKVLNNDTVVEDKPYFTLAQAIQKVTENKDFHVLHDWVYKELIEKKYSQSEVDVIRSETWEAARLTHTLAGMKFDTYTQYLSSLNLNTNDAGKPYDKEDIERWGNSTGNRWADKKDMESQPISRDTWKLTDLPEQPTNDNAFWTDEMIASYGIRCKDNYITPKSFKQSKQPNPSAPINNKEDKETLFTTEDGVDITYGMDYWWVDTLSQFDYYIPHSAKVSPNSSGNYNESMKKFSTKEAAEQYIHLNKPQFSIQEIMNRLHAYFKNPLDAFNNLKSYTKNYTP